MQPSQQHRRRFPSNSSDCNRWMCWLLVSAFFGQSTQQIDSLRARGVRSSHAAVPVDLRSTRDLDRLVALTLDRYERVDILVNNASELGPTPLPYLADYPPAAFDDAMQARRVGPQRGQRRDRQHLRSAGR